MKTYVNPPKTPVTKGSMGIAAATIPNVCKMPGPPAPFVPVPLPNIGKSGDSPKGYTKKVKVEGKNVAIKGATFKSMGDVASKGTGGGLVSANTHGPTKFVGPGSLDTKFEGKNVQLLGDPMLNNCGGSGSPPNSATLVGVLQSAGLTAVAGDEPCPLCNKQHGTDSKLEEDEDTKGACSTLKAAIDTTIAQARAANAARLAAVEAEIANEKIVKASKPRKQRGPHTEKINALEKEKRGLAVNLTGMMGVVKCKDHGYIFAGMSLFQYTDLQANMPGGWHSPKAYGTLKKKPDRDTFDNKMSSYFAYGKGSVGSFAAEWAKLEVKSEDSLNNRTDEVYYPPGSCAAQQMVLLCMDHGDRPMGLTERYYTTNPSAPPLSKLWIRKPGKHGPKRARLATPEELGPGKPIPPCGTCQVILTMMMCNDDDWKCDHKKPKDGVCHKC
ncbi:MAG: DUF4150 domain-containing protein [Myxococcota bacterium]